MPGSLPEWLIEYPEYNGSFMPMEDWEAEGCEQVFANRQKVMVYWWPFENDGVVAQVRYEVDIIAMMQTNTKTMFQRRVIRLAENNSHVLTSPYVTEHVMPDNLAASEVVAWYFDNHGIFVPMMAWEVEACEKAYANRVNLLVYWWPFENDGVVTEVKYQVDIFSMMQTNMKTMFSRRIIRLAKGCSHSVTSPYLSQPVMIQHAYSEEVGGEVLHVEVEVADIAPSVVAEPTEEVADLPPEPLLDPCLS